MRLKKDDSFKSTRHVLMMMMMMMMMMTTLTTTMLYRNISYRLKTVNVLKKKQPLILKDQIYSLKITVARHCKLLFVHPHSLKIITLCENRRCPLCWQTQHLSDLKPRQVCHRLQARLSDSADKQQTVKRDKSVIE